MQTRTTEYKAQMARAFRNPSHMRVTVHTTPPLVYEDGSIFNDIISFTEKKTAHPVAGALPSIKVTLVVDNMSGDYNPDSPSGLYEEIIKGVKVTYEYGYRPNNTTVWMHGGEVFTTGELKHDETTATIECMDALYFLTDTTNVGYGMLTMKALVELLVGVTNYPVDDLGNKKLAISPILHGIMTNKMFPDQPIKQTLQEIANACCVKIYVDREGYLHFDNLPETIPADPFLLVRDEQSEKATFTKGKNPKVLTVNINSKLSLPNPSETLGTHGEDCTIDNKFVDTTAIATNVLTRTKYYMALRNTAEIDYRGEPAIDILDIIKFDTEFEEGISGIVTESELKFNGVLYGSLTIMYESTLSDNSTVKITGAENMVYEDGGNTASPSSVTLSCVTNIPSPTYQWSYMNTLSGGWSTIAGATSSTLSVPSTSGYLVRAEVTGFRCVVAGKKGATVSLQRVQKNDYLGMLSALPTAYNDGNYFLVSSPFGTFKLGDIVRSVDGVWTVVTDGNLLSVVATDAMTLSIPDANTSAINEYIKAISALDVRMSSTGGTTFKNGEGTSLLGCQLYRNDVEVDADGLLYTYTWRATNGLGVAVPFGDSSMTRVGKYITVTNVDVDVQTTFRCEFS